MLDHPSPGQPGLDSCAAVHDLPREVEVGLEAPRILLDAAAEDDVIAVRETPGNRRPGGPSSLVRAVRMPRAMRTPLPGTSASARSCSRVASAQRRTSSAGPAN